MCFLPFCFQMLPLLYVLHLVLDIEHSYDQSGHVTNSICHGGLGGVVIYLEGGLVLVLEPVVALVLIMGFVVMRLNVAWFFVYPTSWIAFVPFVGLRLEVSHFVALLRWLPGKEVGGCVVEIQCSLVPKVNVL